MRFPFDKYKYYHSGNQVIAVSTFAGKTVKGVAKCDPHDTFSLDTGKRLAALKCNNKITAKRLKRAALRYVEAEKAVVAAQKHAERMKRYYMDAKAENKEADTELTNLLAVI